MTAKLPPVATLSPLIALLLAVTFFATQSDRFLTIQNFSLILQQVMVVGTIAIGQTLIILTAGIDLSCGMVMALGGIVMIKLTVGSGMNPYLAVTSGCSRAWPSARSTGCSSRGFGCRRSSSRSAR